MKIDPNTDIERGHEMVLCEGGSIRLFSGERTSVADLGSSKSAFQAFCRSLDPNKSFIVALVPEDADRPVFFKARDVSRTFGIHMQAPIDTAESARATWADYVQSKQHIGAFEKESNGHSLRAAGTGG